MAEGHKHIKVAVRLRPLQVQEHNQQEVVRADPQQCCVNVETKVSAAAGARKYEFDAVFPTSTTQEELYHGLGIQQFVEAVTNGIHATVLAYGQTGSGKTHTMEGFPYQSTKGRAPSAECDTVRPERLGVVPRALQQLFAIIGSQPRRRFSVRCSFVQVYKEQAYDLLNPSPIMLLGQRPPGGPRAPQGDALRATGVLPSGSGALRMRWSPRGGFHLENLYWVGVEGPEEALEVYKRGVGNKVMAAHRLNAASSRSHALFTVEVAGWPLECPAEALTANLTLVDLAGSERAAETGSTSGPLKDESIFINKSLMTLRKVILLLSQPSPPAHVPYRDSKLTCLLQNTLGGSCLAAMVACASPAVSCLEETISTLDYASRAKSISNKVEVNEDPKTKLIRQLRVEVALLREQLAASNPTAGLFPQPRAAREPQRAGSNGDDSPHTGGNGDPQMVAAAAITAAAAAAEAATAALTGRAAGDGGGGGGARAAGGGVGAGYNADVEVLGSQLVQSVRMLHQLSSSQQQLQQAYARVSSRADAMSGSVDALMMENAQLRDRLSVYEGLVSWGEGGQAGGSAGSRAGGSPTGRKQGGVEGGIYTASAAALIELAELRRENQLLHECLRDAGSQRPPSGPMAPRGSLRPSAWSPNGNQPPRRNSGSPLPGQGMRRTHSAGRLVPSPAGRRDLASAGAPLPGAMLSPSQLKAILRDAPMESPTAGAGNDGTFRQPLQHSLVPHALTAPHRISTTGKVLPHAAFSPQPSPPSPPRSGIHKAIRQLAEAAGQLPPMLSG